MIDLSRQRTVTPPQGLYTNTHIIGCGNLGSAAAIALCRGGIASFTLWDDDVVSSENLATQQYRTTLLGLPKVTALATVLREINPDIQLSCYNERFQFAESRDVYTIINTDTLVVLSMDNIESRRAVWAALQIEVLRWEYCTTRLGSLVIDPRMAFEDFTLWAIRINGHDTARDEYDRLMQDETQVYDIGTCGATSVGATGMGVAGFVMPIVRRWLNRVSFPKLVIGNFADASVSSYWRKDEPKEDEYEVLRERKKVAPEF